MQKRSSWSAMTITLWTHKSRHDTPNLTGVGKSKYQNPVVIPKVIDQELIGTSQKDLTICDTKNKHNNNTIFLTTPRPRSTWVRLCNLRGRWRSIAMCSTHCSRAVSCSMNAHGERPRRAAACNGQREKAPPPARACTLECYARVQLRMSFRRFLLCFHKLWYTCGGSGCSKVARGGSWRSKVAGSILDSLSDLFGDPGIPGDT